MGCADPASLAVYKLACFETSRRRIGVTFYGTEGAILGKALFMGVCWSCSLVGSIVKARLFPETPLLRRGKNVSPFEERRLFLALVLHRTGQEWFVATGLGAPSFSAEYQNFLHSAAD